MVSRWEIEQVNQVDSMVNMSVMVISYEYIPKNICTSMIRVSIDQDTDTISSIHILGGCHGNLVALMKLLKGRNVRECIDSLKGIKCGRRGTSCPDQIAKALEMYLDGTWKG